MPILLDYPPHLPSLNDLLGSESHLPDCARRPARAAPRHSDERQHLGISRASSTPVRHNAPGENVFSSTRLTSMAHCRRGQSGRRLTRALWTKRGFRRDANAVCVCRGLRHTRQ